mmetsp:Transcript_17297/g.15203  ORF Transcript_17297/g.15203 Transcript_17297/m.15203 type:complete len:148 (-) Transcript_17297:246-689(-)
MGSLLFDHNDMKPRYLELYDEKRCEDVAAEVAYEAFRLHKTTPESAISLIHAAGVLALPKLLKFFSLASHGIKKFEWKKNTEIPIPTDLGKNFQFHSIFVCPVTKEESSHDNPPTMLKCGHVISKQATKKLLTGNRTKFKCPYCPVE